MRKSIFTSLERIHIPFEPTRRVSSSSPFLSNFRSLRTLILGDLLSSDGPFVPDFDLAALPPSITYLELNIANGNLALFKLSPTSLNASSHGTTCLPLKTILPNLQHLHFMNGYRINYDPFAGLDLLDEISQLPLLSLTYSPFYASFSSLSKLPSTLLYLKIDCTNWMKSESVVKVTWPKSLLSLDIRYLDDHILSFLDFSSLPIALSHLRIQVSDSKANVTTSNLDLERLPSGLESLYIRHLGLKLNPTSLRNLTNLHELRLYIGHIKDETSNVYQLLPRSLRTLHLFCARGSPQDGAYYDSLPRGLVEFCCDRPFGLYGPLSADPSILTGSDLYDAYMSTDRPLAKLPSTLRRSRTTPSENDCSPDEVIRLSLSSSLHYLPEAPLSTKSTDTTIGDGAGMVEAVEIDTTPHSTDSPRSTSSSSSIPYNIVDMDIPVGTAMLDWEDSLLNLKRLNVLRSGSTLVSDDQREFFKRLKLDSLAVGCFRCGSAARSITCPKKGSPPALTSLEIDFDKTTHSDYNCLATQTATLRKLSYPSLWFLQLEKHFPPTLTDLELIRPIDWALGTPFSGSVRAQGRPLELFKLLPPTLLRLRCAFPFLYEGNIFALLPSKLQEVHLYGSYAVHSKTSPNIPVDQLFHLPRSLTRLTLPSYDTKSDGIRLYSASDVQLLQRFFAERPQLRSFSVWKKHQLHPPFLRNPIDAAQIPWREGGPAASDHLLPRFDWLHSSFRSREVSHTAQNFHPASSLRVAIQSTLVQAGLFQSPTPVSPTLEAPLSEATGASSTSPTKKKKSKTSVGGFLGRLFGVRPTVPEEPVAIFSPSEPSSSSERSTTRRYIAPENDETRYEPQLEYETISSLLDAQTLSVAPIADSSTSPEDGYAEYWANETLNTERIAQEKAEKKEAKRSSG